VLEIEFEPEKLIGSIKRLQEVQIPNASRTALNQAAFQAREELRRQADKTFSKPVPFTINSFLYDKATPTKMEARIFIRDDAPGGNPPSRYLLPHIAGINVNRRTYLTRFQIALENTVAYQIDGRAIQAKQRGTFMQPRLNQFKLNQYGNIPQGQYNKVLTSLKGGASSADYALTRGAARQSTFVEKGRFAGQAFIAIDETSLQHPYYKNRFKNYTASPGIYRVVPGKPTRFYLAFKERTKLQHEPIFPFFDIAENTARQTFNQVFSSMILR
jgi:hypothetical protein